MQSALLQSTGDLDCSEVKAALGTLFLLKDSSAETSFPYAKTAAAIRSVGSASTISISSLVKSLQSSKDRVVDWIFAELISRSLESSTELLNDKLKTIELS